MEKINRDGAILLKIAEKVLTTREYDIVSKRLWIEGEPLRFHEIGEIHRISGERVRGIFNKSLEKLRTHPYVFGFFDEYYL